MFFLSGLRVLMYHKVCAGYADGLTVNLDNFISQIEWLKKNKFRFCAPDDLINQKVDLNRAVLITFDDAYKMNYSSAIAYLETQKIPSLTFVPTAHVGQLNSWDKGSDEIASWDDLSSQLKYPHHFYGIHCHFHKSYRDQSLDDIKNDLLMAQNLFKTNQVPFVPFLAYPFGNYPKKENEQFFGALKSSSILYAFRIGQRLNRVPFRQNFLLERIDMRGDTSEGSLRMKIRFGKLF